MLKKQPSDFTFKDVVVCGDSCVLINPKEIGCKWDNDNARFRSCLVRKSDNFIISQLYPKFVNFFESPDFQPWNNEWKFEARRKMDGSLLGISKYKGEIIARSRGSIDFRQLPSGVMDLEYVEKTNEKFFSWIKSLPEETYEFTFLFEITSPNNVIVLREHSEPTLTLLGMIHNQTAILAKQDEVDYIASRFELNRPQKYEFSSIEDCIREVTLWEGVEGVVITSPDGQTLKKIKASLYCKLHKILSGMKSLGNVLDVFMESPKFEKSDDFYKFVETTLDWEIAEYCKDSIKEICEAYCIVLDKIKKADNVVQGLQGLTRKEQALDIQQQYSDWRTGYCFSRLDGKEMDDKTLRKAIEKELKI